MELIDDAAQMRLEKLVKNPPHAVLLVGQSAHSSNYEARALADQIAGYEGTVRTVSLQKNLSSIGVDQIRGLYKETRSKRASKLRRDVWIVEDAGAMSLEAQNAFLKLLEEPPSSVVFILAARQASETLATIQSRCLTLQCPAYQSDKAAEWLASKGIDTAGERTQLLFLAEGSVSELTQLAEDEAYRTMMIAVARDAKTLAFGTNFEKIVSVNALAGDREKALMATRLSVRMLMAAARRQADNVRHATLLEAYNHAYAKLLQNGNVKAQLLRAVLS